MNTEQIISFLEGKEAFDQKALSQIMLLLEKYPYFQTGHILLLKALNRTQSENYGNQLNISGSFISDKKKLFQFIKSDTITTIVNPEVMGEKKTQFKKTDETIAIKTQVEKKEKEVLIEKSEKEKQLEKVEIKQIIEIEKKEPEKVVETEKTTLEEKTPSDSDTDQKLEENAKDDLSEDEIIQLTTEKSKIRHKEIIKDFFQATHSPKINKEIIESEKEQNVIKQEVPIDTKKEDIIKIIEPEKSKGIKEYIETEKKEEKLDIEKEINYQEKKALIEEAVKEEKAKIFEHKKIDIIENQIKEETKIEKEELIAEDNSKIIEKKDEIQTNKIVERKELVKNETASSEVMSNIFSKIRQIKKEMNITSENTPETIDIQTGNEISRLSKTKQTDEKKGTGRVIKETFIGFHEDEIKNGTSTELDENDDSEKEVIKESGITAKDLFKQHVKNKEESNLSDSDKEKTDGDSSKTKVISPISKVVSNLDDEKTIKPEIEKEIAQTTFIEAKKEFVEENKVENNITSDISLSAAELLIKKIQDKKQRMKEEKEKEEREKLLEKQRMIDIIHSPIVENTSIETTIKTEPIDEINVENMTFNEPIIVKENNINENTETTEFKVKKSSKLIDSFIEKIETFEKIGSKESSLSGDVSISSADEKEEFMTETMADIQIQQKNYTKAIEIYQKLILKFPEKKTYFAIQIKKVESLIKS